MILKMALIQLLIFFIFKYGVINNNIYFVKKIYNKYDIDFDSIRNEVFLEATKNKDHNMFEYLYDDYYSDEILNLAKQNIIKRQSKFLLDRFNKLIEK